MKRRGYEWLVVWALDKQHGSAERNRPLKGRAVRHIRLILRPPILILQVQLDDKSWLLVYRLCRITRVRQALQLHHGPRMVAEADAKPDQA